MSLFEAGQMMERLDEYLAPGAQVATLPKDAQDYSEWIKRTNQRLDQVMAMMDAGDLHQAMQLERVDPCLSDLVALLDFAKSKEFRKLCQENGLDEPPKMKRHAVARLNELYAADLNTLDDLWREYNGARLRQEYASGLEIIRRIIRAKPDDKNAQQELYALEKVDFDARFEELEGKIAAGDYNSILQLLDQQEPLIDKFEVSSAQRQTWVTAKQMQARVWAQWLSKHHQSGEWQDCQILSTRIQNSLRQHEIELPAAETQVITSIGQWADQRQAETSEDVSFSQHYIQLQEMLGQARLPNRHADLLDMQSCLQEIGQLSHAWQNSQQFPKRCTSKISQEVYDHHHIRCQQLDDRIMQLRKKKTTLVAAFCVVMLLVLGIGMLMYTPATGKTEWQQRVSSAMATNLCLTVSNQLAQLETDYGTNDIPGSLVTTYTEAKGWLADKNTQQHLVATQIAYLTEEAAAGFNLKNAPSIATNINSLSNQVAACCGDEPIQKALKLELLEVQKPWVVFLVTEKEKGETLLKENTKAITRDTTGLDGQAGRFENALPGLKDSLAKADPYSTNQIIKVRPQIISSFNQAKKTLAAKEELLKSYHEAMGQLGLSLDANASAPPVGDLTLKKYDSILQQLVESGFMPRNYASGVKLASDMLKQNYSDEIMLHLLFNGEQKYLDTLKTRRQLLYPGGGLINTNFWSELEFHPHYYHLQTNKVEQVKLNIYRDKFKKVIPPPPGFHMVTQTPPDWHFIYLDRSFNLFNNKPRLLMNYIQLKSEYAFPPEVERYRAFSAKRGLRMALLSIDPATKQYRFKVSPMEYLDRLQIRMHPAIAAFQQQEILKFIFGHDMDDLYAFGIPPGDFSQKIKSRLDRIYAGGITAYSWKTTPDFETRHKEDLKELQSIVDQCKELSNNREALVKAYEGGIEFAGFYLGQARLFKKFEGKEIHIIYLDSENNISHAKQKPNDGSIELGKDGLSTPSPFSPLFVINKEGESLLNAKVALGSSPRGAKPGRKNPRAGSIRSKLNQTVSISN